MAERTAFDFTLNTLQGEPLKLEQFAGSALDREHRVAVRLHATVYEGLQALWSQHRERGLTVIGVPSNQFGRQEPGSEADIASFCSSNYGVSFPMTEKLHVRGPEADPLFRWLAQQGGPLSRPRWNFFKYVIGRDGRLKNWFSSVTSPDSKRLRTAVSRVLLDR